MKKYAVLRRWLQSLFLGFCLFLMIPDIHAQVPAQKENRDSLIQVRDALYQKGKRQKTTAWILISGGALVTVGSAIAGVAKASADATFLVLSFGKIKPEPSKGIGAGLLIGLGAMVGSIPLFIAGNKNKDKALLMDLGIVPVLDPSGHSSTEWAKRPDRSPDYVPGVTVSYRF